MRLHGLDIAGELDDEVFMQIAALTGMRFSMQFGRGDEYGRARLGRARLAMLMIRGSEPGRWAIETWAYARDAEPEDVEIVMRILPRLLAILREAGAEIRETWYTPLRPADRT